MKAQNKGPWTTMVMLSIGLLVGVGAAVWMTPSSPLPDTQINTDSRHDQRLATTRASRDSLTQALQVKQTNQASPEPTRVAAPANDEGSRQALAQLIRDEVRQAVADASPEAQRAREEAIAEAEILNSPENRAAYQSAPAWCRPPWRPNAGPRRTRRNFRAAFGLLTNINAWN